MNKKLAFFRVFTIIFPFLLALSLAAQTTDMDKVDIVFDLDWTLISPLEKGENGKGLHHPVLTFEGQSFMVAPRALQVLKALSKIPGVRISFFSGGKKERNHFVLDEIKINSPDSGEKISLSQLAEGRILSFEDLTPARKTGSTDSAGTTEPTRLKFSKRFKKDLKKINPNLENIILVDDIADFGPDGQEENTLHLGKTYKFFPSYRAALAARQEKGNDCFIPSSSDEWFTDYFKMVRVYHVILESLKELPTSEKSFSGLVFSKSKETPLAQVLAGLKELQ